MDIIEYLDFDLSIEKSEAGYRARVLNSPSGEAKVEFNLPFNDLEIENFILRVGRTRQGTRRFDSPEMQQARKFGGSLFETVFDDEVRSQLRTSLNEAQNRKMGLRIRLRLSEAPELMNLPWEYLYDSAMDQFLVLTIETPIVRYLDIPREIPPLAVKPPLNILVLISSPSDYPPLEVEREWSNLQDGLSDLIKQGAVTLDRLEKPTLSHLQQQLRRKEYHIFHYIGHGGFDEASKESVLILEDEAKRGQAVSGGFLGTLMQDEKTLRLAVLNACEGARSAIDDPFAGAAQSLVQRGIPAVIAMQFEITDEASITLAHEFYNALADGYPVDAALTEARKAILGLGNDVEWGTPVLYMRAPDGQIFDLAQVPPSETVPLKTPQVEIARPAQVEEPRRGSPPARPPVAGTSPRVQNRSNRILGGIAAGLLLTTILCASIFFLGQRLLRAGSGGGGATQTANTVVAVRPESTATSIGATSTANPTEPTEPPAVFAPAALTPTPTPPVALNLTNNREGKYAQFSLLFDAQNLLHLIYYSRLPRGGDYYHQQRTADGAWMAAERLTDGFDFLWSDLVQDRHPEGYICVLWGGISSSVGEAYFKRCQNGPGGAFSAAEIWRQKTFDTRAGFSPLFLPDGSVQAAFERVGNSLSFQDQVLSDQVAAIFDPHLVQDAAGSYHLVWFRAGNPYSLEYSYSQDAGASWSPAERLTTEANAPDRWFDLAADTQGNLHLVWMAFDGRGVYYRRWTPAQDWSEPIKIAPRGCGVKISVNTIGLARVAEGCWNGVYYIEQISDGAWLPPYQVASLGNVIELDIAVDKDDRAHIVWLAENDIFFTSVRARGSQ
jgi:hypothetical protein